MSGFIDGGGGSGSGFTAGGDLSGSSTSQLVIGIQGNSVKSGTLGAAQDGYILQWINIDGKWEAKSAPSGFTAGQDLAGSSTAQQVIKINGASVPAAGSLTTGNVLQVSGASAVTYGAVNLAGGANFVSGVLPVGNQASQTLGGDLSGTTAAGTVIKINGATAPAAGSLTTGNVLQVTGTSALSYGTVNLAGGANFVSGVLPVGNQASQSMGGDVSGTTAAATVTKIQGNAVASTTLASNQDGYVLTFINADNQIEARVNNRVKTTSIAGTYSINENDAYLMVDTTASRTITCPDPSKHTIFTIKDISGLSGTNPITLNQFSTETIDGYAGPRVLSADYNSWRIWSDGVSFWIS